MEWVWIPSTHFFWRYDGSDGGRRGAGGGDRLRQAAPPQAPGRHGTRPLRHSNTAAIPQAFALYSPTRTTPYLMYAPSHTLPPFTSHHVPRYHFTTLPLYQQAQAAERLQHMQAQYLVAPASNSGSPNRRRDPRPHPQHPHQQQHGTNSSSAPSPSKTSAYLSRARDIRSGKATGGSPGASIAGQHGSDRRASSPSSSSTRDRGAPLSLVARARLAQKRSAALKGKFRCIDERLDATMLSYYALSNTQSPPSPIPPLLPISSWRRLGFSQECSLFTLLFLQILLLHLLLLLRPSGAPGGAAPASVPHLVRCQR